MNTMRSRHLSNFNTNGTVFNNYIETTVDPGQTLLIDAVIVCIGLFLALPLVVKFVKLCLQKHKSGSGTKINGHQDDDGIFDEYINRLDLSMTITEWCNKRSLALALQIVLEKAGFRRKKRGAKTGENMKRRKLHITHGVAKETQISERLAEQNLRDGFALSESDAELVVNPGKYVDAAKKWISARDAYKGKVARAKGSSSMILECEESSYQPPPIERVWDKKYQTVSPLCASEKRIDQTGIPSGSARWLHLWTTIMKYDDESERILHILVPLTLSAVTEIISDLVILAVISHSLGTDSMIAYIMVDTIVGVSSSFLSGWTDAICSLCSMSYGAGNFENVGQYVLTGCIFYVQCEIPMAFIWGCNIQKVILMMGFGESVADLAQSYVWVQVAMNMVSGVDTGFMDFLEVVERGEYVNILYCISTVVEVVLVASFALGTDADLVVLGNVMLANEALFCFIGLAIPFNKGWLKPFTGGPCALDVSVLKQLFKTALPLSLGNLLACAEWEILLVFAAILGPAEAATWCILGFVWGVFESTTGVIGDATEIRCAYHFGKGQPALAKLSAYKSILMALATSFCATTIFLCVSSVLPSWLTKDATIQDMLAELFPLIAAGNVTMAMGMVCWSILGAQKRYRLATSIATACSLLVTIPIGAVMTLSFRYDLQGLTFAVVIGYTVMSMVLSVALLVSDWDLQSKKILDKMAAKEDSGTDDESDESGDGKVQSDGMEPVSADVVYINGAAFTSADLTLGASFKGSPLARIPNS